MNANPLKARYKKGKRLGGKGWKILGDRDTSMVRKKPSWEERDPAWIFLGKRGSFTKQG